MRIRRYETVFVLPPDLDDGKTLEIVSRLEGVIDQQGGTLVRREDWGVRKLAYEIKRCSRGHYFLLDYAGPAQAVSELERHIKIIESILRFLTVKKEETVDMEAISKEQAEEREKEEARKAAAEERRASEAAAAQAAAEAEAQPAEETPGETAEDEAAAGDTPAENDSAYEEPSVPEDNDQGEVADGEDEESKEHK